MFKRASSLSLLMAAVFSVPLLWAAVPVATGTTAGGNELAQANVPVDAGLVSLDFRMLTSRMCLKCWPLRAGSISWQPPM